MASSKVLRTTTSNSQNSDISHRNSTIPSSHTTAIDFYNNQPPQSTLLDAQITLVEPPIGAANPIPDTAVDDDVWREIVDVKEEALASDEMMTLEDFLARASGIVVEDVKAEDGLGFSFDANRFVGPRDRVTGKARRARGPVFEPMDKAAEQRQRRMIKNRESAARSRERKQAYQNELECLAARLEEENGALKKEKAERIRKRLQQLKEDIIPIEEKRRPAKALRRTHSWNSSMLV